MLSLFCNETNEGRRYWIDGDKPTVAEFISRGAKIDHALVWVNRPAKYREACTYARYGNEPHLEILYVAAAVIVEIPEFGTTRRNGVFP